MEKHFKKYENVGKRKRKQETLQKIKDGKTDRENMYYNLQDKIDAKFMFIVTVKDVKPGDELTANYNLYTYPKTGVGIQMI